ncbi:uncharacterized protein TRIADDRAFT_55009 [Trichoplax adhaerens]|uniref:Trichohyalin-plectin-homology domain-containing protein n=1 Tax=Trichoplax adhaerens TaxID=10228 RepID=B3RQJ2_TRIAD|nr:hypothetical protein TRIADDRAFT_55009 [Trichoplax adhaerens]EDV27255.1 hypothetical protein TRIADDRAFT_55009 [Trichoplax adhaerens]|eukprot:XP_002111251.1 hypothetical protein TRIADDRAFT_55009 [Trichoplax adhaerens]
MASTIKIYQGNSRHFPVEYTREPRLNQESINVDDIKKTALVPKSQWDRMQYSLTKSAIEAQQKKAIKQERDALHESSKGIVKYWPNTIEGKRLKRLQARQVKEEQKERERLELDKREDEYNAQMRKNAIKRAKELQYFQTDRIKNFHSALLTGEVLKEREAQIDFKKMRRDVNKEKDERYIQQMRNEYDAYLKREEEEKTKRRDIRKQFSDFQLSQVKEKESQKSNFIKTDLDERKKIDDDVRNHEQVIKEQAKKQRKNKQELMSDYKEAMAYRQMVKAAEKKLQEQEEEETRLFAEAKKRMIRMRKEKESDLFKVFKEHNDRMVDRLRNIMVQKVDDEDDRIARAVAERDREREEIERLRKEKNEKQLKEIAKHRKEVIKRNEKIIAEEKEKSKQTLERSKQEYEEWKVKEKEEKKKALTTVVKLKQLNLEQIGENTIRRKNLREQDSDYIKNMQSQELKDEKVFQKYAANVIKATKKADRNPLPLVKAANQVMHHSTQAITEDGNMIDVQRKSDNAHDKIYGRPLNSKKRLGFNWD